MMIKKIFTLAAVATCCAAMTAQAATLNGNFFVTAVNVTNLNSTESQATLENFNSALDLAINTGNFGGDDSSASIGEFNYDGLLDFRVGQPQNAAQSIADFLDTSGGSVTGLNGTFGDLQLSESNLSNGTATTTFFLFTLANELGAADFTITHDDGVSVFDDGELLGATVGPTGETTSVFNGFDGGFVDFLYVATNGNPSIFEVDAEFVAPVPVPAALPLMLAGIGVFGWVARRRKTA